MSLRQMLRYWLAWRRAERGPGRPLPVVLALPAPVADATPLVLRTDDRADRWASVSAVLAEPTVEPPYLEYRRPCAHHYRSVAHWMVTIWPDVWDAASPTVVDLVAFNWLELQQRLQVGEVVS